MTENPPPSDRLLLGIALRCGAATSFALMGAMLKMASASGAALPELVFYRSLGALPVVAGWVMMRDGMAGVRPRRFGSHVGRSTIGLVSMTLIFAALALLPLAEATALSYSAPVTATLLSALFLREAVGVRRWLAVLVGFCGVLLVARPGGNDLSSLGIACGVGAAIGQGAVMITVRQMARTETTSAIAFWFTVLTLAASSLPIPFFGHWHDLPTFALLLGAGLIGGVGQLTMTGSLRFAPVSTVVPFDYLQMIWAPIIGWLVFATPASSTMLAGAALIAASGIYTAYREHQRGQQPAEALTSPEA